MHAYVCLHLSEVCVHVCCVLELLMACHACRGTYITDYDIQRYAFPLITMSFMRIAKVHTKKEV